MFRFLSDHGRQENDRKWSELADELNLLKGSTKTVEQWKRHWCDLK